MPAAEAVSIAREGDTLRFSGAYTDATYRKFPRAPNPAELGGGNPAGAT